MTMTLKRLLLSAVALLGTALILLLAVHNHQQRRERTELFAKLQEFVHSDATEISAKSLTGAVRGEICAISDTDLDSKLADTDQARKKMLQLERHLGFEAESGRWYLALYGPDGRESRVLAVNPSHLTGFVSRRFEKDLAQSLDARFCLDVAHAKLAKVSGASGLLGLYLKEEKQ